MDSSPDGTEYEEEVFTLSFAFPEHYPFKLHNSYVSSNYQKEESSTWMSFLLIGVLSNQKVQDILEKLVSLIRSPSLIPH